MNNKTFIFYSIKYKCIFFKNYIYYLYEYKNILKTFDIRDHFFKNLILDNYYNKELNFFSESLKNIN